MNKSRQHIDKLLKERFGNHADPPPPAIWDKLESRLKEDTGKKPFSRYWPWLITTLVFLIAGGLFLLTNESDTTTVPQSQPKEVAGNPQPYTTNPLTVTNDSYKDPLKPKNAIDSRRPINNDHVHGLQHHSFNAYAHRPDEARETSTVSKNEGPLVPEHHAGQVERKMSNTPLSLAASGNRMSFRMQSRSPESKQLHLETLDNSLPANVHPINLIPDEAASEEIPGIEAADSLSPPKRKRNRLRFTAAIKGGFELGLSDHSASRFVLSPSLQLALNERVSISVQPGIKYGSAPPSNTLPAAQSYYRITGSSFDSISHIAFATPAGPGDDTIYRTYTYTQAHDSITVSYGMSSQHLLEIELPILLQFKLKKKITLLGGISLNYSNVPRISENKTEYQNIVRTHKDVYDPEIHFQSTPWPTAPPAASFESKFSYTSAPYSSYDPSVATNGPTHVVRLGYMAGLNWQPGKKTLIEAVIQQSISGGNNINKAVRPLYMQPYLRLAIGYVFGGAGK